MIYATNIWRTNRQETLELIAEEIDGLLAGSTTGCFMIDVLGPVAGGTWMAPEDEAAALVRATEMMNSLYPRETQQWQDSERNP
jgi:hypothetical protein